MRKILSQDGDLLTNIYLKIFFEVLNEDIKPNQIDHNNKFNNPNVLIAGCGNR